MMTGVGTAVLTLLLLSEIAAEYRPECMDLDEVAKYDVIFRGLVTHVPAGYVLFSILEVYKGGVNFGGRRKVGVLIRKNTPCDKKAIEYRQYIVMTKGSTSDITPWSIEKESIVWSSLGWHQWSEWSPCSQTCNGGKQERRRICSRPSCPGPIVERRECNTFDCNGSISLLDLEEKRYFHPARRTWERVPDRQTAWSLHQNSYVWVPAFQLFHDGTFPKDFSLLITLRIRSIPTGTLFSVRCRRQQDTFLSLEIAGENGVTLIHSGPNGTQSVNVSARLADGHWHQISMSVRDRSIVRSYIDCQWISTVVLKKNSLMIPDDADIVIGYLFLGDLEQLVLVPKVGAESEQCSSKKTSEPPNLYTYKDSPYHSESVLKEWMRYVPNYGVRHVNILCKHECLNGGKCVGPDQCECPRNSTGPTCALPVCEPPCEHAATCAAGNRCVCAPGTTGTRCEQRYSSFSLI